MNVPMKEVSWLDMDQTDFANCLERAFKKFSTDSKFRDDIYNSPTKTLKREGINLKQGYRFKVVHSEKEKKSLPTNIIPILFSQLTSSIISTEELRKVSGGRIELFNKDLSDSYKLQLGSINIEIG